MACAPSHLMPDRNSCGRPKAIIDWNYVNGLLISGCSGAEIAGSIGLNKATIYERCLVDNGIPFAEYSQQMYSKGDALLRNVQFEKALSGDNTMLVWLGKSRLKQTDPSLSNANNAQKITVEVKGEGLASGVNISTTTISNTDNTCPE